MRILAAHRGQLPPADAPQGEDAFVRLTGSSLTAYNAGRDAAQSGFLSRGAVCPLVIDEISLPTGVGPPINPIDMSEQVATYYENAKATILMPSELIDEEKRRSITPFPENR